MKQIVVKLAESQSEIRAAFDIRHRVFVQEQQIPGEEERDEADDSALHAIAVLNGEALGTGRVVIQDGGIARIGRMAVDKSSRGIGVGGRILTLLEDEARAKGSRWSVLHAQEYIKAFYVNRGYQQYGEVFDEVDIPHVEMRKRL